MSTEILSHGSFDSDLFNQCYAIRVEVFHDEQGFPLETELDAFVLFHYHQPGSHTEATVVLIKPRLISS
jgi:hypothetical protein